MRSIPARPAWLLVLLPLCATIPAHDANFLSASGETVASSTQPARLEATFSFDGWTAEESRQHAFTVSMSAEGTAGHAHEEVTVVLRDQQGEILADERASEHAAAEASTSEPCPDGPCDLRVDVEIRTTSVEPIVVEWHARAMALNDNTPLCHARPQPADISIEVVEQPRPRVHIDP